MATHFEDTNSISWNLPDHFHHQDVRMSENVVGRYIERFSNPGDVVFDPFAGFGTTLLVAERMGRIGEGLEILADRATYANSILSQSPDPSHLRVRTGDARTFDFAGVQAKLVITSPPYMNCGDIDDPLTGYRKPSNGYETYVAELVEILVRVASVLSRDGNMVVQLQNLRSGGLVTPLTFDVHAGLARHLRFVGDEILTWSESVYGYTHGYCLIYEAPPAIESDPTQ